MDAEKEIKEILKCELKILLDRLKDDFSEKKEKKRNNWILDCFDGEILSNMIFVSSFESKYGNMFEKIAFQIARLRFGSENVKYIVKSKSIENEEFEEFKNQFNHNKKQYITTKLSEKNSGKFSKFREDHKGDGNKKEKSLLTHEVLSELLVDLDDEDKPHEQEVDLLIYNDEEKLFEIFEIKAGGNLDSTNSKGNVEKLLKIYSALGYENSKIYFATLYNKDGDENNWKGSVKYQIGEDSLLIGKDFWEKILPTDISFIKFKEIYLDVCEELNFKEEIRTLINEYS